MSAGATKRQRMNHKKKLTCGLKRLHEPNFNGGENVNEFKRRKVEDKNNLLGFLGKGTFGRVAKARNLDTCQIVALKIARSSEGCRESARNEIAILKKLRDIDPEGKHLWIQMLDHFEFQGHVCIAFEKLGDSLYSFLVS
ncbi:Serine/threonine-protein kinase Doa [Araneus ventricosus]|uniref:Serine/threonine-protein kinase Doa n=1 Tax=Araneus ventricosus TaxID=182803 RepID=A0A4Y2JYP4_ARAVE|nr:Serine/threonine-protein kinase Doa [Araneus ventricosus]